MLAVKVKALAQVANLRQQEGKIEGKIEFVLSLADDNISVEQLSKYTKLSIKEVKKILKEHRKI